MCFHFVNLWVWSVVSFILCSNSFRNKGLYINRRNGHQVKTSTGTFLGAPPLAQWQDDNFFSQVPTAYFYLDWMRGWAVTKRSSHQLFSGSWSRPAGSTWMSNTESEGANGNGKRCTEKSELTPPEEARVWLQLRELRLWRPLTRAETLPEPTGRAVFAVTKSGTCLFLQNTKLY